MVITTSIYIILHSILQLQIPVDNNSRLAIDRAHITTNKFSISYVEIIHTWKQMSCHITKFYSCVECYKKWNNVDHKIQQPTNIWVTTGVCTRFRFCYRLGLGLTSFRVHRQDSGPLRHRSFYWLVFWGAKFLHLTRSEGGIPNFFFLLSVSRLKKNPHVGLPTVLKGAIELELLGLFDGSPGWVFGRAIAGIIPCVASLSSNIMRLSFRPEPEDLSTLKWRLYLLLRPKLCKRWASNLSHVTVLGFPRNWVFWWFREATGPYPREAGCEGWSAWMRKAVWAIPAFTDSQHCTVCSGLVANNSLPCRVSLMILCQVNNLLYDLSLEDLQEVSRSFLT